MKLVIVLSIKESKSNKFLVLDTYNTRELSTNKIGKYNGRNINPINVFECDDYDNIDSTLVKNTFSDYCYQVDKHSFYINVNDLSRFFSVIQSYELFFIEDTNYTLYLVNALSSAYINKKTKYSYLINGCILSYYLSSNSLFVLDDDMLYPILKTEPEALLIKIDESRYSLCFKYSEGICAFLDRKRSYFDGINVYLRNYKYECAKYLCLSKLYFRRTAANRFVYYGLSNDELLITSLSTNKFVFVNSEDKIIPKMSLRKRNRGWFDVELTCEQNGEIVDLASKIDIFAEASTIDGKKVCIPNSLKELKKDTICENGIITIKSNNTFLLLKLLRDSGQDINLVFDYKDVSISVPDYLKKRAYDYQLSGIKWLKFIWKNKLGGCLADDMGLGKTFQIISFLSDTDVQKELNQCLIIVPKSLISNWINEFKKFKTNYRVGVYHGDKRDKISFDDFDIIITTYSTARLDIDKFDRLFSVVVFDEIQTAKNSNSETSRVLKTIKADTRFGLSGTPMENNISELWNVMDLLNPGLLPSKALFLKRYLESNRAELKELLSPFILRRRKSEVLTELPPKTVNTIYCDMDSSQRTLYNSIVYSIKESISEMGSFASAAVLKGLLVLRECCCHPLLLSNEINVDRVSSSCKLENLMILIENITNSNEKVIVFSQFTRMLDLIKKKIESEIAVPIFYLTGKTNNRQKLVDDFENSKGGVFLISIKAGGLGLNLVSAQNVVLFDPWWNPFAEEQAIDRIYRIGQQKPVSVYKLISVNTLEERILDMQLSKQNEFDEIINDISEEKNIDLKKIVSLL